MAYLPYHQKIAQIAKRDAELAEGARNAAKARRAAKRAELQPEYTAVSEWMDAQFRAHGLSSVVLREAEAKMKALDAIVAAVE